MVTNDIMARKVLNEDSVFEGTGKKYAICKISVYRLFWMFLFGGTAGFLIESMWGWFNSHGFTSRTSNLFFPISCVWGFACVLVCIFMRRNQWSNPIYLFMKGTLICAVFEFACGWFGQTIWGVTFWDYTVRPFHIGKYVNVPFCLIWGILSFLWIDRICPKLDKVTEFLATKRQGLSKGFLAFMVVTTMISGFALLRMEGRQKNRDTSYYMEIVFDRLFPDRVLQWYFPDMKDATTGEKIYKDR